MKTLLFVGIAAVAALSAWFLVGCTRPNPVKNVEKTVQGSVYDFKMKTLDGSEKNLADYKGKVLVFINVASNCGYTKQYEQIEAFYKQYSAKGVEVLGFPANNFMGQEPGTDAEIKSFCQKNYGVSFQMFSKISVKGSDMHPLYKFLTEATGQGISWNFNKIVVGKDGKPVVHFGSKINADNEEFLKTINAELAK